MTQRPESDPRRHTEQIKARLRDLIEHLREEVEKVDDAQAKALFETTAETLGGLVRAFEDFEAGDEAAWRGDS